MPFSTVQCKHSCCNQKVYLQTLYLFIVSGASLLRIVYPCIRYDFRPDIIEARKIIADVLLKWRSLLHWTYALKVIQRCHHLWTWTNLQNKTFEMVNFWMGVYEIKRLILVSMVNYQHHKCYHLAMNKNSLGSL